MDETGFLMKGNKAVGVQHHYRGTAGRVVNCQARVFLAYAGSGGRVLLDRELYLPQVWAEDLGRRRPARARLCHYKRRHTQYLRP